MMPCVLAAAACFFYTDSHPLTSPIKTTHESPQVVVMPYENALTSLSQHFVCSFINEEQMPLVIAPKASSKVSYKTWAASHRAELTALMAKHGGILLRGFPIKTADSFSAVVKATLGRSLIDYKGGEGSRHKVADGVYTSTEAPAEFHIPLHHELTCTDTPPDYISFFCEIAPEPGTGQTCIASTERVTQAMLQHENVWSFFDGQTIKYISRHPPEGNYYTSINNTHKTWQEAFETDNKEEVERICQEKGFEFQWLGDWIEVVRRAPATRGPDQYFDHPYWYNQAHLYHANPRIRGGWLNHTLANLLYIIPSTRQYDVELEGGVELPQDIVYEIYDVLEAETVLFDWQQNDVLILDNRRALHGRMPYEGQRRILVSMVQ